MKESESIPQINKMNYEITQLKEFYNLTIVEIFNNLLKIFDPFNGVK